MPMGAFFSRAVKMTKKPIMTTDLNPMHEEDFKKHPKRSSLEFEISHQKHYHHPPTVHKNLVEHETTTRDEKREIYDDRYIDVDMEASRLIEQVRKKIGYGDQGLNVGMEDDRFVVRQKPENIGLTSKDRKWDVDIESDRFIKRMRHKIGMTTKDGKKDSCDDQDIDLDTEIDRFTRQRPKNDGKWDFGDDDQDTNIDMEADRFIKQEREKFGRTTKDWNRVVCDDSFVKENRKNL